MSILRPIAAVTDALGISGPVNAADSSLGRCGIGGAPACNTGPQPTIPPVVSPAVAGRLPRPRGRAPPRARRPLRRPAAPAGGAARAPRARVPDGYSAADATLDRGLGRGGSRVRPRGRLLDRSSRARRAEGARGHRPGEERLLQLARDSRERAEAVPPQDRGRHARRERHAGVFDRERPLPVVLDDLGDVVAGLRSQGRARDGRGDRLPAPM